MATIVHVRHAGDEVDRGVTPRETVRRVVPFVDRRIELVAKRLQRLRRIGGNTTNGLDMQHDVDVVSWPKRPDPTVNAVELGHQPAHERPLLVREHPLDLSDVRPRRTPTSRRAGYIDGQAVNHGTTPTHDRERPALPVARGRRATQQGPAQRARHFVALDHG